MKPKQRTIHFPDGTTAKVYPEDGALPAPKAPERNRKRVLGMVAAAIILGALLLAIAARADVVMGGPPQPYIMMSRDGVAQEISPEGHAEVEIHGPASPFGEVIVTNLEPAIQNDFIYGSSTENFRYVNYGGASTSTSLNMLVVQTGAQQNSMSAVTTRRSAKYRPGQGTVSYFAGMFSTATTGSNQFAGLGSGEAAIGFGTLDDKFGIYFASGNYREVQTLVINTKSSNDQVATVTLAGQTFTCQVSNGANAAATAWEIANSTETTCDFKTKVPGWFAEAKGSSVTFIASTGGNQTGTMDISFPTSGSGSFTETIQGAIGTTEFIPQASWNMDTMDGSKASGSTTNPSGFSMDYTKGNVFRLKLQYLGFGDIEFGVEDANTGELNTVHRLKLASARSSPTLSNPNFSFAISAQNTTGSSVMTTKMSSLSAFIAGTKAELGRQRNFRKYTTGIGTTFVPIISIRNPRMFRGRPNQIELLFREMTVANLGLKGLEFAVVRDPKLNNTASFVSLDTGTGMEYDTSATSYTGGSEQDGGAVGNSNTVIQDLHGHQVSLAPGDVVSFVARSVATTTDISVSIQVIEDR